ncbi:hypothetical protein GH714_039156 [Hevea brasiliensis]|uniref:Uncharacterized protein n=1 Tax=Hevea brasiliensis TaxID=3981 RepID=A0A6A6MSK0_HEVBR|nr:hypothetical protein GH714_039156 [Hevea brasiliensis]
MVFRSASETHQTSPHRDATKYADMASSTLKSHQPLHNFPLQDLKWSMNHTNNHRFRKFAADSSHKSPQRDTAESDGVKTGNYVASPDRVTEKSEKKLGPSDTAVDNSDRKSKIFIRIRTNSSKCADDSVDAGDQTSVVDDAEETITKTWNLRPRRAVIKASDGNGGVPKICGAVALETKAQEPSRPELTRSRNTNDAKVAEKKEKEKEKKLKLSIPLTKEEIEEDVYALTGSKPARRPRRDRSMCRNNLIEGFELDYYYYVNYRNKASVMVEGWSYSAQEWNITMQIKNKLYLSCFDKLWRGIEVLKLSLYVGYRHLHIGWELHKVTCRRLKHRMHANLIGRKIDGQASPKNWNLRPNRSAAWKKREVDQVEVDKRDKNKKMTPSFGITLPKEEIEKDILAIIGAKLPRRKKKKRHQCPERA